MTLHEIGLGLFIYVANGDVSYLPLKRFYTFDYSVLMEHLYRI